ncbi:MAG: hypothetical protein H0V52_08235 [Acidimicrobiia bacterium]|nr:hypothetical protein [Acidimicrobiia bacterium]
MEPPPYATVTAVPDPVGKGDPLVVTATAFRGTISSITAEGCGADEETSVPATPNTVTLTIPATQPMVIATSLSPPNSRMSPPSSAARTASTSTRSN